MKAKERWHNLCEKYARPDDLPTWEEAGHWTMDKLYFWKRYVDITTAAMDGSRGRRAFPDGLVYVDLFGGAGVCTLKSRAKTRFPGSAIIAAHAAKPFQKIIVCEKNEALASACRYRLENTDVASRCTVLTGDCNNLVYEIVSMIPRRALTLALVDPKGLDARFETVKALADSCRVDFVVLFADAYDIIRNLQLYHHDPNSSLDQVLGPDSGVGEQLGALENPDHVNRRKLFA